MARGLFLSLDGLDGTGKSTQCRYLVEWLRARGGEVTPCADPGGTPLGDEIRGLLLGHRHQVTLAGEAFLFMASRAQLVAEVIRPALDAGRVVVCDRYLLANVVYQGYAGGLDVGELEAMGRLATQGILPDLTLILDLPVDKALARRNRPADRMEQRARDYQEKVRQGFLAEARRDPGRRRVLDADQSAETLQGQIRQEVERVLAARAGA